MKKLKETRTHSGAFFFGLLFMASLLLSGPASFANSECEKSFVVNSPGAGSGVLASVATSNQSTSLNHAPNSPESVYVLKFDTGAGFVRVVAGRIFMVERDASGETQTVEVFHDRGVGIYSGSDVFYPISWPAETKASHQLRKVFGQRGYEQVQLIARDGSGLRFIARNERGELGVYRQNELFPLASSQR